MRSLLSFCLLLITVGSQAQNTGSLAVMQAMESTLTGAIEDAGRSIVAIARVPKDSPVDATGNLGFNLPGMGKPLIDPTSPNFIPTEFGTGVIISESGDVLTAYHVLGNPEKNDYYVWHQGVGREAKVTAVPTIVQAGDPWTDLAVLRFEGKNLRPIKFGDAKTVKRGSFVVSLGNPYAVARDGTASASLGIVANLQRSATKRSRNQATNIPVQGEAIQEYGTLIQTDAKLNLGTSGGALINLKGEMIGLTTSLAAVAGYETPAGFAIPIDSATQATIKQLQEGRTPTFGFIGLEPIDPPAPQRAQGIRGAVVRQVLSGMPADRAGIRSGDLITEVDGQKIDGAMGLFREMSRRPARSKVEVTLLSGNPITNQFRTRTVSVTLGKKYLALSKPGYSRIPPPSWRGLRVDYGTALPPTRMFGFGRPREILPVAIVSVDPDTPAWNAGLRPGQFIREVAGKPAAEPDLFYKFLENEDGPVEIEIIGATNRPQRVTVLAE